MTPGDNWLKDGNILLLLKDMQVLVSFFFLRCFINYVYNHVLLFNTKTKCVK